MELPKYRKFLVFGRVGIFGILLGHATFGIAQTQPSGLTELYPSYTGVRQLGMGGAYTAVVNDETSMLTNPAALGKIRGYIVTLADPEIGLGGTTTDIATASTYSTVMSPQGLLDSLNTQKGKHFHAKVQAFPSAVFANFGFGLNVSYRTDAEVDTAGTNFDLDYKRDITAVFGFNFRFWDGIIKIGFAARIVDRTEASWRLPANSTNLSLNTLSSEGMGVGGDAGIILTSPTRLLPSIAAVVHDIGGTNYNLSDGLVEATTTRPRRTDQRIDVGLAIQPILSNHTRLSLTADYFDITGATAEETKYGWTTSDPYRRVHAGMEFNFSDFFFLRAGMNQRYYTAGFEIATQRFQIQGATYGEEIGTPTTPREDRRYVGKLAIRF